jgi:hypothetical protein
VLAHERLSAAWTLQQFREVVTGEQSQRFVVHDRDRIYSAELDAALESMDLRILRSPRPIFCGAQARGWLHPNREASAELESAGFDSVDYEKIIAPTLVVSAQIVGIATKAASRNNAGRADVSTGGSS